MVLEPSANPEQGWRVLVAEEDGRLLGFVSFRLQRNGVTIGHIGALYVVPKRFKSGVGTALLVAASDELRAMGADKAFLWVLRDDAQLIEFYEARGWLRDGARMTIELDQSRTAVRCTKRFDA